MTFDEAIAEIGNHCAVLPDDAAVERQMEIVSGGFRQSADKPLPALYATRELAIAAWCNTMLDAVQDHEPDGVLFIDGPHLDKHIMTNQTERGAQRTVEDRFSVTATVGLTGCKTTAG